jgi:hypothetical protein
MPVLSLTACAVSLTCPARSEQDEGSAPEGYSLAELCVLARSSLRAQRALALRMMAAVAQRARPGPQDVAASGHVRARAVALPAGVAQALAAEARGRGDGALGAAEVAGQAAVAKAQVG